jgi:L-asparaginase
MRTNQRGGRVAVFFTGGTIGMRPRVQGRGVGPAGDFNRLIEEMGLDVEGVTIGPVAWGDRPSGHMTPELMFRLAKDVDEVLADEDTLGAVVLHGTDVVVESAFMADLTVVSDKPVVFTGAMRFISELGYDGIRNLVGGIRACLLPLPAELGVVLLMTDRLFAAREVAKINSLNIDAFQSPESGPVGYVTGDQVILTRRAASMKIPIKAWSIEPNVALIAAYTGMTGDSIDHLLERGVRGVVVEAFGAGNVPPALVPAIERAVADGVPVVIASRCLEGGVWPIYGYPGGAVDLEEKGAVLAGRLSGPKARLLLMAALSLTRDLSEIKKIFRL